MMAEFPEHGSKLSTSAAETTPSLMTPARHRAVTAGLRQADPRASGEDSLAQLRFARLHHPVAEAIEARDK